MFFCLKMICFWALECVIKLEFVALNKIEFESFYMAGRYLELPFPR